MLRRALPLRPRHAKELVYGVKDLSRMLTSERGGAPPAGYMTDDRFLAAYVWYFLPWNLFRLARLLRGLEMDLPEGGVVLDLGAGPLTFPLALWLSRPELRERELTLVCVDRSQKALTVGAALFEHVSGGGGPWRVKTVREQVHRSMRGEADLVVAANLVNELAWSRNIPLSERMERFGESLADTLAFGGRVLVVDPGIRASGKALVKLRRAFLDAGLYLLAPCPHSEACPMSPERSRSWCHFNFDAKGAPRWLADLTGRAGLDKTGLSLSFLYAGQEKPDVRGGGARIVSNAFHPYGRTGPAARYACRAKGLGMLLCRGREDIRPGDLLALEWPKQAERDQKTGAAKVVLAGSGARPDARTDARTDARPGAPPRPASGKKAGENESRRRPQRKRGKPEGGRKR